MMHMTGNDSPLTFPCRFPIKVMGKNLPGFEATVVTLVQRHAHDFDATTIQSRLSKGDRYLSLTLTVHATSKAQLDAIYRDLTACEDVAMVL
jgi:putative lipoic acid-binding regulatory protein